ncbi:NLR family CARD domain-containing protein 3 [Chanos chanos]|uniref:NLR family CARD domain-containing protein 3 n=1 Tax=Chanos chanos TaxID=29144 RepID=A0A6J2V4B2_CHACN|nr:NLR family CARD domain-containing protein 3 [Chanos chanos]
MDRHSHIPWQEDCYMDLPSTAPKPDTRKKMEDIGWLRKNQKSLEQFVSAPSLTGLVSHLRKTNQLTEEEARLIQGEGSLQDRVRLLVELLSANDPQGSVLQAYLLNSHPQDYQIISVHDSLVQQHKDTLLQRLRDSDNDAHAFLPPFTQTGSPTLFLVEGVSDLQQSEHDLIQVSVNRGAGPLHGRALGLDKLLVPLTRVSTAPRVTLTVGVSGGGKTRLVHSFVRQWCSGQIYPDISLVIPIACWEVSGFDRLSMDRLLRLVVPHDNVEIILGGACKVLLVFDGLEEFRAPLDFSEAPPLSDTRREVAVSDLITNIIRGNLLPGATLWLLSRPGVGARVPAGLVDRVTEVPPLTHTHIQDYLKSTQRYRQTHTQTDSHTHTTPTDEITHSIWAHLSSQKSLLTLCSVPSICRIVVMTLSSLLEADSSEKTLPRTLTEVYGHYCWSRLLSSDTPNSSIRKPLNALGRLAFYSLLRRRHSFTESELRAYGLDPPPLPQGSLGYRVVLRERSWSSSGESMTWRFAHTSIQEFLAGVFYYASSRKSMFDLFSENGVSWPRLGFQSHYRAALQRASQPDASHLHLFMRFLSGLLCPAMGTLMGAVLGISKEELANQRTAATTLLQGALSGSGSSEAVSMRSVAMVSCLAELQPQGEVLRSVEEDLIGCGLKGKLKGTVCAVLAYLLQVSEACAHETNLSNCLDSASLKRLLPQLLYCTKLRMESNVFKDDTMELLGSLLSAKDCHIQNLSLAENSISSKGVKALSRALLVNRTLTTLDLRGNSIGNKGAKTLAEALKMNQVIVTVNLQNNHIEDEGARALADVLQTNRKLSALNLQKNSIGPDGVKRMAEALKKNQILQDLNLSSNPLGDVGTAALAQALTVNHTLRCLRLQSSSVSDKGMAALMRSLRTNRGVTTLILRENSIGVEGAKAIAKALKDNNTLQDLDLTANLLHDEGVTAIGAAMKVNQALKTVHLQWNFLKGCAAKALAQALLSNTSLQLLDLQENALGDEGVVALAVALKTNSSLSVLFLQGVSAGISGAVALAEALKVNTTLHTIDLRGNCIGMGGAKALSSALKTNRSLRSLNLQENSLGMDGAIFIATALRGNHQLTYINLLGNGIGESGAKVVSDAIRTDAPECVVDI